MQCGIIFTASALINDRAINIGSIVEKQGKLSVKRLLLSVTSGYAVALGAANPC